MAMWHLPTWDECAAKPEDDRDALERFIYDNTPAGRDEPKFRSDLFDAIFAAMDSHEAFMRSQAQNASKDSL